jgi:hypothetical protein
MAEEHSKEDIKTNKRAANRLIESLLDARFAIPRLMRRLSRRNKHKPQRQPLRQSTAIKVVAFAAAILVIAVLLTVALNARAEQEASSNAPLFTPDHIDDKSLFVPNEPDFLPPAVLGQARKKFWTEQDATPFWTSPDNAGQAYWRDKLNQAVDNMLKRVP